MQKVLIILFWSYCVMACDRNTLKRNIPSDTDFHQATTVSSGLPDDKSFNFPHKPHASALECNACHNDTSRRPTIDQSLGHGPCLDCHRQKHAGPVECTGCHGK